MQKRSRRFRPLMQRTAMLLTLVVDAVRVLRLCLRSPAALAAENLFLRKQLALYQERKIDAREEEVNHSMISNQLAYLSSRASVGSAQYHSA